MDSEAILMTLELVADWTNAMEGAWRRLLEAFAAIR